MARENKKTPPNPPAPFPEREGGDIISTPPLRFGEGAGGGVL